MDILALEGMQFHAKHGQYPQEKITGGEYVIDIYFELDLSIAGKSDTLTDTINYEEVYELCKTVMSDSKNLIEHVAYEIHNQIASNFTSYHAVRIRVCKLAPPIKGTVKQSYVEIYKPNSGSNSSDGYWETRAKY